MSIESLKTRSDLSLEELDQLIKNETDVKIYKKLNFIKLKKEGYSTKQAYQIANLKSDKSEGLLPLPLLGTQRVPFKTLGSSQSLSSK